MGTRGKESIRIDLDQFKLHIRLEPSRELTLHFNSPSRRFYLSLIAFVVREMQQRGQITSIPLEEHLDLLAFLNETVGGSAGSSEKEHLLPRIYRKWKDALTDLEDARLFKVLGRTKGYDDGIGSTYRFTEEEKDSWANLFEYKGSGEHVRLRFSIDSLGASLNDVVITYGEEPHLVNEDAWGHFIADLKETEEDKAKPEPSYPIFIKEPEVPVSQQRKRRISVARYWGWPALAAVLGFVVVVAALAVWRFYLRTPHLEVAYVEKMAFPLPNKPSIAVLPFINMSGDHKQEFFSDGITEEIITALSKVPKIFVIARTSSFKYKGKEIDVRTVGRELGVRYVLEGSVRKSGDKLRITARLIDAQTNQHLWAERYDRDLKDIFAIQDEITMNIITALQVKLKTGDPERLYAKGTSNLAAYLKCLQARELIFGAVAKNEENMLARRLAQEAINLDPNYSEAYRELAATYVLDVWLHMSKSPRVSLERAVELAQKAIALDNSNAHAYSLLAEIYVMLRQYDKAVAAVEQALALAPNSSQVLFRYGRILYLLGRFKEALPYFEEAMRFNPLPPNSILRRYGMLLRELERYDEAIALFKKAIEEDPERSLFSYLALAVTYSLAGREEEARETAKEVLRINTRFSVKHWEKITPIKDPALIQRIASAMRKAGLPD